ncbi:olfactory receptor 52Z1-like [Bufo bufo]|uniref:olfactory receptor 52Z1-like n=1 Tax=Bufo bufo TaxID=8384 RepID=UPI001ABE30DD|nr:olfactory receptor 52Z1-like [Bufo bufo]
MSNVSRFHPDYFILLGIPGLEESHLLLSIPFSIMYILALFGNSMIMFVISSNEHLHQPMYIFLMMLTATDILLCSSAVPKALSIFWFNSHEILFNCCLLQVFSIHFLFVIESSILLTMAYDRYIAICSPLTYTTIITASFIRRTVLLAIIRAFCIITPLVFLLNRLPYTKSNIIVHTYCEHIAMAQKATVDITVNSVYGLVAAFSSTGVDMILVAVSYGVIIRTVLRLPTSEARSKAFSTSMSHICVILLFYIPAFFSFIAHRAGQGKIPPSALILFANLYVMVPPMMNPIIYGIRTKEIRQRLGAMLGKNMMRNPFSVFRLGWRIRTF